MMDEAAQQRRLENKRLYERVRYQANREKKLAYQRKYYQEHREQVIERVKACQRKRVEREKKKLWNHGE
jgi:hypothetical protein